MKKLLLLLLFPIAMTAQVITTEWDGEILTLGDNEYSTVGSFTDHANDELTRTLSNGDKVVYPLGASFDNTVFFPVLSENVSVIFATLSSGGVAIPSLSYNTWVDKIDPVKAINSDLKYYNFMLDNTKQIDVSIQNRDNSAEPVWVGHNGNPVDGGAYYRELEHLRFQQTVKGKIHLDDGTSDAELNAIADTVIANMGFGGTEFTRADIRFNNAPNLSYSGRSTGSCWEGYDIQINREWWDDSRIGTAEKFSLLYHEFGHALLNKDHATCKAGDVEFVNKIMFSAGADNCGGSFLGLQTFANVNIAVAAMVANTDDVPYLNCGTTAKGAVGTDHIDD